MDRGVQSPAQIRNRFGFDARAIEELSGLPYGFLSDSLPDLQLLGGEGEARRIERPRTFTPANDDSPAKVIEFPFARRQGQG